MDDRKLDALPVLCDGYEALADLMAASPGPALVLLEVLNRQFRASLDALDEGEGLLS